MANIKRGSAFQNVTPALKAVVSRAQQISPIAFGMYSSGGARSVEEQSALKRAGWSKIGGNAGAHTQDRAIDLIPIVNGQQAPNDNAAFAQVRAAMRQASQELGVPLTYGADWKGFSDKPHYEVSEKVAGGFKADPAAVYTAPQALPFTPAEQYELAQAQYPGVQPMSAKQLFSAVEQQYGLPAGYLAGAYGIESNYGQNKGVSSAGARGPFQFISSTARQYNLANPNSLGAAADAAARLAVDNRAALQYGLGRDPTPGEMYLAHQQGATGALALLTHPNDIAANLVPAGQISQNLPKELRGRAATMTGADFAKYWGTQFDQRVAGFPEGGPHPIPPADIPDTGAPPPVATAYTGGPPQTPAQQTPAQQAAAGLAAAGTLRKGATDAKTGGAVSRLQQQLAAVPGGPPVAVDGKYGPQTEKAVRAVEKQYGLTRERPGKAAAGPQVQAALAGNERMRIVADTQQRFGGPLAHGGFPSAGYPNSGQVPGAPPSTAFNVGAGAMPGAGALPSGFIGAPGVPARADLLTRPDRNRFDTEAMAGGPGVPVPPFQQPRRPITPTPKPSEQLSIAEGDAPVGWTAAPRVQQDITAPRQDIVPPDAGGAPGGPAAAASVPARGYDTRGVSAGLSSPNVGAANALMQQVAPRQAAAAPQIAPNTPRGPGPLTLADFGAAAGAAGRGVRDAALGFSDWAQGLLSGGPPTSTATPRTSVPQGFAPIPPAVPESASPSPYPFSGVTAGGRIGASQPNFSGGGSTDVLRGSMGGGALFRSAPEPNRPYEDLFQPDYGYRSFSSQPAPQMYPPRAEGGGFSPDPQGEGINSPFNRLLGGTFWQNISSGGGPPPIVPGVSAETFGDRYSPGLSDASTLLPSGEYGGMPGGAQYQASGAELQPADLQPAGEPAAAGASDPMSITDQPDAAYGVHPLGVPSAQQAAKGALMGSMAHPRTGLQKLASGAISAAGNAFVPGLGILLGAITRSIQRGGLDNAHPYTGGPVVNGGYGRATPNPYGGYTTGSSYSVSPFTPSGAGWNAPNFSPVSGGSLNAWHADPNDPGHGTYIDSKGNEHPF